MLHPCEQEAEQRGRQHRSQVPLPASSSPAQHGCDITPPGETVHQLHRSGYGRYFVAMAGCGAAVGAQTASAPLGSSAQRVCQEAGFTLLRMGQAGGRCRDELIGTKRLSVIHRGREVKPDKWDTKFFLLHPNDFSQFYTYKLDLLSMSNEILYDLCHSHLSE